MWRDKAGFAFFLLAAILSGMAAWKQPHILLFMNTAHNAILAVLYVVGVAAAFLPIFGETNLDKVSSIWIGVGIAGELFTIWSLISLGRRFGIAPADRGLAEDGPYCFVRHPMYTGELALRLALSAGSSSAGHAADACDPGAAGAARGAHHRRVRRIRPARALALPAGPLLIWLFRPNRDRPARHGP